MRSLFHKWSQVQIMLCLTMLIVLMVFGCNSMASLDPAEESVKAFVEEKGGMVETEGGHIVTVWCESANLQDSDLEQFAALPELNALYLNYNSEITNKVFAMFDNKPSLKTLELAETKISQRAADNFREVHPEMNVSGPGV